MNLNIQATTSLTTAVNEELFYDYMGKPELQVLVSKWLGSQVYERLSALNK
jgi:type I restriction enzyme, R subunit